MKKLIPLFFLAGLIISGCKKEHNNFSVSKQSFLDSAVSFLKLNLSQNDFDKLDLSKNEVLVYNGRNIGLQVFEKNATEDKYLLVKVHSNKFSGNWVDMSDMKFITVKKESGTMLLTSVDKKITRKLIIQNNAAIQLVNTNNVTHVSETVDYSKKLLGVTSASGEDQGKMLPEVIIYYDVNPSYIVRYVSLYWSFDDDDDNYSGFYHRSRGGGPPSVVAMPQFFPPDTPIDIDKELGCFTNNMNATYKIAININQPNPNTRKVIDPLSHFKVGHTFLTFQQINSDGSSIVRNVGFYPKETPKLATPDISVFGDDSNTPIDVSMTFAVTSSEFMTVVNTVLNQQSKLYDINSFNCTDAPIDALRSININLPSTKSDDPFFSGDDPSDLGEDIRGLDLNNFSNANGNRKITRTVSDFDDQKPPARQGGC